MIAAPLSPAVAANRAPVAKPLNWWMMLLIALAAIGVYANSISNGFALDDTAIVKNNPHVIDLEWSTIWSDNYWKKTNGLQPDTLYRPLTLWSYLANQYFTPGVPWPFHLVNVLLHAVVSVLMAVLAWRLLANRAMAFVAGLLFAVHPLHTEVVANTVGRAELFAALFTVLALLYFLPPFPLHEETVPTRRPLWHGLLVAVFFFAAILSKETPVSLILALPCIDLWRYLRFFQRPNCFRWFAAQCIQYYLPCAIVLAAYLKMRSDACGLWGDVELIHHVVNPLVTATPLERLFTPFALFAKYLTLTFWPVHLSADYSFPSLLPSKSPLDAGPLAGMLIIALVAIMAVRLWRKSPQFVLILGLFLSSYALVANIIRIGTIFGERLFYWPSAFVLMLVAWAGVRIFELAKPVPGVKFGPVPPAYRVVMPSLLCVLLGLMSYRAVIRNPDWRSDVALALATADDNLYSTKACGWAGNVLVQCDNPEWVAFGKLLLDRSAGLCDDFVSVRWDLAKYYGRQNDVPKALIYITQAARIDPGSAMTRMAMDGIIIDLKTRKPETYMPELIAYKDAHPKDPSAYLNLAIACHAQGQFDVAENDALTAMLLVQQHETNPRLQFHEAAAEYARIRYDGGDKAEGITMFKRYAWHVSHSVDAFADLAGLMLDVDDTVIPRHLDEARVALAQAKEIDAANPRLPALRARLKIEAADEALAGTTKPSLSASALPHGQGPPASPAEGDVP